MRNWFIAICFLCTGCAARKPVSANWRLLTQDARATLIPPGVTGVERNLKLDVAAGNGSCPSELRVQKKHIAAAISRDTLDAKPDGWLTTWASDAEAHGCVAPGEASKLASGVAEALPLDPQKAFHVLYPEDLVPPVRLQVVSPVLRDPSKPVLNQEETTGNGNQLTITARADNLIGYETALYEVQAKAAGAGYTIQPLYTDRRVDSATERRAQPEKNYFQFPSEAAYFRLFVKSGQTEYTALAIAAGSRAALTAMAGNLDAGTTSCEALGPKSCVAIPRQVALNPVVPVTVNGVELLVRWGADVAEAMRNAGERRPDDALANLTVSRLYKGRATAVEFDRSNPAILRLPLTGGEMISWKR